VWREPDLASSTWALARRLRSAVREQPATSAWTVTGALVAPDRDPGCPRRGRGQAGGVGRARVAIASSRSAVLRGVHARARRADQSPGASARPMTQLGANTIRSPAGSPRDAFAAAAHASSPGTEVAVHRSRRSPTARSRRGGAPGPRPAVVAGARQASHRYRSFHEDALKLPRAPHGLTSARAAVRSPVRDRPRRVRRVAWDRVGRQSPAPHFVYQAHAWLNGRASITPPLKGDDWARSRPSCSTTAASCPDGACAPGDVPRPRRQRGPDLARPPDQGPDAYVSFPPFPGADDAGRRDQRARRQRHDPDAAARRADPAAVPLVLRRLAEADCRRARSATTCGWSRRSPSQRAVLLVGPGQGVVHAHVVGSCWRCLRLGLDRARRPRHRRPRARAAP